MTKVLLVDVDSKIPNLALMKISAWHKTMGDITGFDTADPDLVYISCIFKKNREQARGIASFYPDAKIDIGGTGISLSKKLPNEIENIKPDYDLYPSTYSQDYTSRGCPRICEFCVVPEKEGGIYIAKHPSEFHDPRFDTCMIMDNNLFATPQYWQVDVLKWFIETEIKMLSPQGWDIRLLTKERANLLKRAHHAGILHFAWDNPEDEPVILKGVALLKDAGFDLRHRISFYVLAGFNTTIREDIYRCQKLRDLGVQAYLMPFRKSKEINALARWTSRPALFWSFPFDQYSRKVKA
jgi:hypothetical protein